MSSLQNLHFPAADLSGETLWWDLVVTKRDPLSSSQIYCQQEKELVSLRCQKEATGFDLVPLILRNCITASGINHFVKEVAVGTITEGKCDCCPVWLWESFASRHPCNCRFGWSSCKTLLGYKLCMLLLLCKLMFRVFYSPERNGT